jgi:hypothetical protein
MNGRSFTRFIGILAVTVSGLAFVVGNAAAQGKKINKAQLVGTWTLVSNDNTRPDGSKVDVFGPNAKGLLIFDRAGHYSLAIMRADLPKFAGSTSDQGTAAENKAVLAGIIAHFGTYSLDGTTLTTHVEASSFPNLAGSDQKRIIESLTADELKYSNPATATGTKAEVVWKRVK